VVIEGLTTFTLTEKRAIMAKTVADQFAQILIAAGVKRIYGIVGDSLNGLTDSIRRQCLSPPQPRQKAH
jgi:hypothetical protein